MRQYGEIVPVYNDNVYREWGRELDLHSQLSQFNGKYAALTAAFLHPPLAGWRGGVGCGFARGRKKGGKNGTCIIKGRAIDMHPSLDFDWWSW